MSVKKPLIVLIICLLVCVYAVTPAFAFEVEDVTNEAAIMAQAPDAASVVLQPEHPGVLAEACDVAVVDYSNTADGYVMACYTGETSKRLKLRVTGPETTYTYNLNVQEWTTFPLSDGNGSYMVTVYRNTSGNKYATLMVVKFDVSLKDEFAPFLRPNQYVEYSNSPETVAQGARLCEGIEAPLEKVAVVYDYVVDNFKYDYDKAATVKSGYLPELDLVLSEKKGICFDYASIMTAMLRSQGIPCKLVVGYAGSAYHAWISVWTEENGWVDGVVFFDGRVWKRMDPTFASSSGRDKDVMDFIENGKYSAKYLY